MDDDGAGPSLPSNYLTFLQLKQRWLQQQQQSSSTPDNQSTHKPKEDGDDDDDDDDDDSTSKPPIQSLVHRSRNHHHNQITNQKLKPDVTLQDSASKTPKQGIPHTRNHHRNRIINQSVKPDVTLQDSASKTPKQVIPHTRNHHRNRMINQSKPDVTPHESASKTPKKLIPRGRNHHRFVNQLNPEANLDDNASKTVVEVADNHQVVEKKEQNTVQSSSKPSTTNNSSTLQNPKTVVTDQIPTAVAPEKKQRHNRRWNRNRSQELRQPKAETPPRAPVVDALSQNDGCAVEAVAAAVKEINVAGVRRSSDRRWGSGRLYGGPAKAPVKKGPTTTTVWVRKGESGSN